MKHYFLSLVTLLPLCACTPQTTDDETPTSSGGSGGSSSNAGGSGGSETTSAGGAQANSSGGSAGEGGEANTEGSSDTGGSAGENNTAGGAGEGGDSGSDTSTGGSMGTGSSSMGGMSSGGSATGGNGGSATGGSSTGGSGGTSGELGEVGPDGLIVKQLAVGYGFACALTVRGGVKCWGEDSYGTLGQGAPGNTIEATDVEGLTSGVRAIAASATYFHVCALKEEGSVVCWGANERQQLNIDDEEEGSSVPVPLKGYEGPASGLTLGDVHWCFVDQDTGGLKCLGANSNYVLGVETPAVSLEAIPVTGAISGYKQVAAGSYDTCGLLKNGGIKCWGRDSSNAVGDNQGPDFTPTAILGYGPDEAIAREIAVGTNFACALDTEGAVKCWGAGSSSSGPVTVSGLSAGVTTIASGMLHSCAVVSEGAVFCWGNNSHGQLGNGEQGGPGDPGAATPVAATGIENALAVGAGRENTCASLKSGGVKCWGNHWVAGVLEGSNVLTPNTVGGFEED